VDTVSPEESAGATTPPPVAAPLVAQPYPPSWFDHLKAWAERLPGGPYSFYLALAAVCLGLEGGVKWADHTYPAHFQPWHLVMALMGVYFLALMHRLDRSAARALAAFRPALADDEATFAALRYRLLTLPAGLALLASLLEAGAGALVHLVTPPARYSTLYVLTSPAATVVDTGIWLFFCAAAGLFAYHTLHQLRLINQIYTTYTRLNLFDLHPLYAFSGLTARTAVGLLPAIYAWWATLPTSWGSVDTLLMALGFMSTLGLAVATFVWPLWGVHDLLEHEKARRLSAVQQRLEAALGELQHRVDTGELGGVSDLKNALDGLVTGQAAREKIPTWPWPPGTLRNLGAALLLPIILWLITRLLERLLAF
jgi:hypothetical protein